MVITYHGAEFFRVQVGDTVIAFNPISKDSKLKGTRFGADVALSTINHPDMNGLDQIAHGEKEAFQIYGPGEYEVKDIFIKGYPSLSKYGSTDEEKINTIYSLTMDNVNICFLGAVSTTDVSDQVKEMFDQIDVLFIPVGTEGTITPAQARKLVVALEPKVVIPMGFDDASLKTFLKESSKTPETVDKFSFKKKDLEGKDAAIVVINEA